MKTFWISRELHASRIWSDFPVKYCCVPDRRVRKVLVEIYGPQEFKELFKESHENRRFDLESRILMSEKIWDLISKEKVDSHYPYNMPFFRKEA